MATVSAGAIRAGRALLGMSQADLAELAKVSTPTIRRIETDQKGVSVETVNRVQGVLEEAGIEFMPETEKFTEGVRQSKASLSKKK
jgi:transcriptional regulator with XRE-family HTH domain